MTQEDKQLIIKDLCARLPYGVKVCARFNTGSRYTTNVTAICADRDYIQIRQNVLHPYTNSSVEDIRPYLRPMSSMTAEELMEFGQLKYQDDENWEIVEMRVVRHDFLNIKCRNKHDEGSTWGFQISRTEPLRSWKGIDWLLEHHFDFRGLIPKGLALEAPDNMYKTE